jgi:TDG/mug DNA glycosylase family protein
VALVGITVFRAMFPALRGAVSPGVRPERIGVSRVFVLPNPSGRNATMSYAGMLTAYRGLVRLAVEADLEVRLGPKPEARSPKPEARSLKPEA